MCKRNWSEFGLIGIHVGDSHHLLLSPRKRKQKIENSHIDSEILAYLH